MPIEQLHQDDTKEKVEKDSGAVKVNYSTKASYDAKKETEKEHEVSEKNADKELKDFLKHQEKFQEDMREVWDKAKSFMGMGDIQKALDALYPAIKKNQDFIASNFIIDNNVWTGVMSGLYADEYQLRTMGSSSFTDSPEVSIYKKGVNTIYQQIANNEGQNKGKDMGVATFAIYFLSYPSLINKELITTK